MHSGSLNFGFQVLEDLRVALPLGCHLLGLRVGSLALLLAAGTASVWVPLEALSFSPVVFLSSRTFLVKNSPIRYSKLLNEPCIETARLLIYSITWNASSSPVMIRFHIFRFVPQKSSTFFRMFSIFNIRLSPLFVNLLAPTLWPLTSTPRYD